MGRTPDRRYFGKIWPNGNFSIGTGPVGSEALELSEVDGSNLAAWGDRPGLAEAVARLTSSNAPNSHTEDSEAPQRGLNGITGYGQQMLRSGCYVLERDYGNADLCFATLTVPALSGPARVRLAQSWSELVRQLGQWLNRRLAMSGRPTKWCGCVEIQTARLERSSEAYLHLHVVWPAHSNNGGRRWAVEWEELRSWWAKALCRFAGEASAHLPRVELAPVKKSAERYMGKYLSKGNGEALEAYILDVGVDAVPSTWWFMSATLRSQVKAETACGPNTGTMLDAVIQHVFVTGDFTVFEWVKHVEIQCGDRMITVGWCGRLRSGLRDDLLSLLSPLL